MGCTCNRTAPENWNGICQKRLGKFDGLLSCVVNQPSLCTDLENSTSNPEKQLSAEACLENNQGIIQTLQHIHFVVKKNICLANTLFIVSPPYYLFDLNRPRR